MRERPETTPFAAPPGWYGRLVVGFVNFSRWPLAKKAVLVMSFSVVFQANFLFLAEALDHAGSVFDMGMYRTVGWAWLGYSFVALVVAALINGKGRWSESIAFLLFVGYMVWVIVAVEVLGGSAGAYGMFPIAIAMIGALVLGPSLGTFIGIFMLLAVTALNVAHLQGWVPFAASFLSRDLDAANESTWYILFSLVCLQFLVMMGLMSALIFSARDYAERALHHHQDLIRRYVPSQVADAIISGHADDTEKHERRKLTIFFSDLVGFTDISEELEPEDLSRVLNEYFSEMTDIAQKHGGTVDELSGDAILIFFGAPVATNDKDHALRAVRMATEMQQAIPALNAKWRAAGITEALQVRMGINTGVVTIGNFGSPDRMKYAALGKHVNLAARIQAQCEPGKALLSHATWLLVNDHVQCTPKGEMQFKGIHKPVMTYEVAVPP